MIVKNQNNLLYSSWTSESNEIKMLQYFGKEIRVHSSISRAMPKDPSGALIIIKSFMFCRGKMRTGGTDEPLADTIGHCY